MKRYKINMYCFSDSSEQMNKPITSLKSLSECIQMSDTNKGRAISRAKKLFKNDNCYLVEVIDGRTLISTKINTWQTADVLYRDGYSRIEYNKKREKFMKLNMRKRKFKIINDNQL